LRSAVDTGASSISCCFPQRGQGIGTDIIEAVARAAREKAASELVLSVLSTNAAARRLYLRLGFAERGGDAYVEMAKTLDMTAG
jgi:predicted GNAT family acetyltransferase